MTAEPRDRLSVALLLVFGQYVAIAREDDQLVLTPGILECGRQSQSVAGVDRAISAAVYQ